MAFRTRVGPQFSRCRVWELACTNAGRTSPTHREWGGALGAAGKQAPCLLPEVLGTAADRVGKGDYAQRGSSLQLE